MNRKSLFGRLAKTTMVSSAAERQEYFRAHLEPLEDRKLLALTVWYNDDWINTTNPGFAPVVDDIVASTTAEFGGGVSGLTYGTDAFGTGGGTGSFGGSLPFLHDAIIDDDVEAGATILIGSGTYAESDIVVSKALTISAEAGNLFVPEVTSSGDTSDFGAGTHSGFIITAGSVTISGVHLDGNGGGVGGSLNYHHGITTLYTNPAGGFVSIRDGSLTAVQIGDVGEHGPNETVPNLKINNVIVENVFWHGITMSAIADKTFNPGEGDVLTQRNLTIRDSIVTNVGPGTKTEDHIGILVQNLADETPTDLANLNANTITNVGIGVKAAPFGTPSLFFQDGDGLIEFNNREDYPNNHAAALFQIVNNASIRAFDIRYGTNATWFGNEARSGTAGATGFYVLHAEGFGTGLVSEGYGIGLHIQDDHISVFDSLSPWRKWRFTGTWETDDIVRMTISGQSLQVTTGSTVIPDIIDTFVIALNASGQSNFTPITWSRVGNDLYGKADSPSANATGTVALFESNGTTAGDLQRLATTNLVDGGQGTSHGGFAIGSDQPLHNLLAGSSFTGPGTATAGSVGLLINNDSTNPNSSDFFLSTGVVITGFETGVKIEQTVTPANQRNNTLAFDRPDITGNGTDLVIGEGSILTGESRDTIGSVKIQGNGKINLRFNERDERNPWFYENSTQPVPPDGPNATTPIVAHDVAGTLGATNITLGASTSFTPLITGQTLSGMLWDFNDPLSYGSTILPPTDFVNGTNPGPGVAALTAWGGLVTQDGTGTVVVGGPSATNGAGTSAFYGFDVTSTSWAGGFEPTLHYFNTLDLTGADHLNVKMKLEASTDAKVILFGMIDDRGNWYIWGMPIQNHLNAVSYTTLSVSLLSPEIELEDHTEDYGIGNRDDLGFNLSRAAAYFFGGDAGFINGNQNIPLSFRVDEITMSSQKASALTVTGSIDLGGATLSPEVLSGYTPVFGDQITIINKISGGAVTGTFAGLAEGGVVTASTGHKFKITYAGGDGNEVVLTDLSLKVTGDATAAEGDAGNTNFVYTVTQSVVSTATTTVQYTTTDGSATSANSDYVANSGTLTFSPGVTMQLVTVQTTGDLAPETDEAFTLVLSNAVNAGINDGTATQTILNDDAGISINDVSQVELNAGTSNFVFSVTLANASTRTTTVQFATADGTATTADSDYVATSGTLTFTAGQVSKTVTVVVNGDVTSEANQTFLVNLSSPTNGTLVDGSGTGTILNDDVSLASVIGRHIFYNQSGFDGNSAAMLAANDNSAIAPDKTAYIPNGVITTFTNVTSYSRGINGIMVDITGSHPSITTDDFIFKVGNNNTPSSWATIAATSLSVTAGGGVSGSDRVEIIWATGTITNKWLEVQVLATGDTGLASTDVFFWGNRIGDSGTSTPATTFSTTSTDVAQATALQTGTLNITNLRDFNRLAGVTSTDIAIANANQGTITRINIPTIGPFAPAGADEGGGDGGGSAVASALAAGDSSDGGSTSSWIAASLAAADGGSSGGSTDTAKADSARSTAVGDVADELEDDSLDELLADLAAG